jgi:TIR domain
VKTRYEIQLIHRDQGERVTAIREAVAAELLEVGLHRAVDVVVDDAPASGDAPSVGVYLGDEAAAGDPATDAVVEAAASSGLVVIPIVPDLTTFARDVPARLSPVNGFEWRPGDPARRLARVLLAELGIEERQRHVFISHKREDGLGAAEQLHDVLSHHRFVPFIDRFVIREGEPVQATIADALEDYAFLLLLETAQAHTSDWVFDEVDYALSHTMGTLIVRWPGVATDVPGSASLPRLKLQQDEIRTDEHGFAVLIEAALDRVIEAVEAAHAHGLVRRRRMLIRSIEEAAAAGGATTCVPLPDWRLLVEHEDVSTVVGVTPRLPTAEDLQRLDAARDETNENARAVLVHSARVLHEARASHLTWVTADRDLELTPENAIGGRWR